MKLIITTRISCCSVQFKDVWLNFLRHPGLYHLFIWMLWSASTFARRVRTNSRKYWWVPDLFTYFFRGSLTLSETVHIWPDAELHPIASNFQSLENVFAYKCVTNVQFVTFPFFFSNCNIQWGNVSRKDNIKKSVMTNHDVTIILLDARYKSTSIMP